jgi:hypothetical protein
MAVVDIINDIQAKWQTMLANCWSFRMHLQADEGAIWSVATALTHVYHDVLPAPGSDAQEYTEAEFEAMLPAAFVWTCPQRGFELDGEAVGDSLNFYPNGMLKAVFIRQVASGASNPDQTMRQWMSQIMYSGDTAKPGLVELMKPSVGFSEPLAIHRMKMQGPEFGRLEWFPELGAFQHAMLTVEYR